MEGNPAEFEAIGNRLGFRVVEETSEHLRLSWRGPRFPAFLCMGIALLLLLVSIPIAQAIYLNGFASRAASLWYFPVMNLILIGIGVYLLTQSRAIVIDGAARTVIIGKRNFHKTASLKLPYEDIERIRLGSDRVYSGFAVAGSSAAQSFPVPSLRLYLKNGASVLVDRGGHRRLKELGDKIAGRLGKKLEIETAP